MPVTATINATLNGQSATVTAYEDTTGDGNADNQQAIPLRDGQGAYQFPALVGGTSNTYWLRFGLQTDDDTTSPQVHSATVEPEADASIDLAYNATLNGQSAYATILEDTTGDGNADTWVKLPIPGGSGTLGVAGTSGTMSNDHWIRVDLETGDTSQTPQVDSLSISGIEQFIQADVATISITGEDPSIQAGEATVGADAAVLDVVGVNPTIAAGPITISADVADLAITAPDAAIAAQATIPADTGVLSAVGPNPSLAAGPTTIQADTATATLAGENPAIEAGAASISADAAVVSIVLPNASIAAGEATIPADAGELQVVAQNADRVLDTVEVSGTVELNGSGVQGAKVLAVNDSKGTLADTQITDSSGDYRFSLNPGDTYHIAVQYDNGSTKYNDESKPFITPS